MNEWMDEWMSGWMYAHHFPKLTHLGFYQKIDGHLLGSNRFHKFMNCENREQKKPKPAVFLLRFDTGNDFLSHGFQSLAAIQAGPHLATRNVGLYKYLRIGSPRPPSEIIAPLFGRVETRKWEPLGETKYCYWSNECFCFMMGNKGENFGGGGIWAGKKLRRKECTKYGITGVFRTCVDASKGQHSVGMWPDKLVESNPTRSAMPGTFHIPGLCIGSEVMDWNLKLVWITSYLSVPVDYLCLSRRCLWEEVK